MKSNPLSYLVRSTEPNAVVISDEPKLLFKSYVDLCEKALLVYQRCSVHDIYAYAKEHSFRTTKSQVSVIRSIRLALPKVATATGYGIGVFGKRRHIMWVLTPKPVESFNSQSKLNTCKKASGLVIPKMLEFIDLEIDALSIQPDAYSQSKRLILLAQKKWFVAGLRSDIPTAWKDFLTLAERSYESVNH